MGRTSRSNVGTSAACAALCNPGSKPAKVFGTGTMKPIDYCVALADGTITPPSNLDISTGFKEPVVVKKEEKAEAKKEEKEEKK